MLNLKKDLRVARMNKFSKMFNKKNLSKLKPKPRRKMSMKRTNIAAITKSMMTMISKILIIYSLANNQKITKSRPDLKPTNKKNLTLRTDLMNDQMMSLNNDQK